MTPPDGIARFASGLRLPLDGDEPIFAEPWQAQAFAITVRLHEAGCFTWSEWADTLAAVLREVRQSGESDDGSHYYSHWLVALERLVAAKHLVEPAALDRRKEAWGEAYRTTPHGQPVVLRPSAA